jgi:hypothetical protein
MYNLVGVSNLWQVNLLCAFRATDGVHGGHKIYICSGRTSLHPVIGDLHYRHHWWSKLVRGDTSDRERERRDCQVPYHGGGGAKGYMVESYGLAVGLRPLDPHRCVFLMFVGPSSSRLGSVCCLCVRTFIWVGLKKSSRLTSWFELA